MALTGEQKTQIANGVIAFETAAIAEVAGAGLGGTGFIGIAALPLILGLQQEFNRVRFPQINIGRPLTVAREIRSRGLTPRISLDPFFGDVIVSARDQDFFLEEIIRTRALRRVAASLDTRPLFEAREQLSNLLADTAVERGFFATTADIPAGLRGGVVRDTADSPLRFVPI